MKSVYYRQRFILNIFLIVMTIGVWGVIGKGMAQPKGNNKIDQFPTKYELKDTTETINIENLNSAIAHHEKIIEKFPNEPFIPHMMFELAELTASKAQYEFREKMRKYDEDLKKFEKGETFGEPIMPMINLNRTIDICYEVLEKYKNIPFKDKILYRLAISHLDQGNYEKAKDYFHQLIFEVPGSDKVSEANFRLGEYYFNQRDFYKAIEYYEHLLERWDDPYFNYSLYKLGWCYYNVNDYTNAISTFTYLITDITLLETLNTELLGKTKADVRNEAIDYIAHSLTEYEGPKTIKDILSTEKTAGFAIDVLRKMAEIYKKRNFYKEAINTYQALLDLYPYYPEAPLIQKEIIQCYESDLSEDKAAKAKDVFVQKYGPNSDWLRQHPEGDVRTNAVSLSEEMLYSLGTHYQAKAQEKNRGNEYRLAIEKHEEFLKKFRDSEKAPKVNFLLAECYYAIEKYDRAADEYFKVMTFYDDDEFKETAAYNRILSYFQLLKQRPGNGDSLTYYLEDYIGGGESVIPIKVANETQFNLLKACNDFVRQLPESEYLLEVLIKYAETLYELKAWDLSARIYKITVKPEFRDNPYYGQCINMIAQCYLKMRDWTNAEKWFNNLGAAYPDSAHYVEKSKKMVASSKFKYAEGLKKDGKSTQAAVHFLKLAFSTNDEKIAKAAIFQAANQFEEAGDIEKAVKAYERMLEEQPQLIFKDELLMKTALLYEKTQNWVRASNNYIKLVEQCPNSQFVARALLNAAMCYEQLELWYKCKQTYQAYINRFANGDPDDYVEALYRVGEISYNQGNKFNALKEFEKTVQEFKRLSNRGVSVEEYLPAKAQFMIAEINYEEFNSVKIVPPLNLSMKRKTELLQQVLKNYVEAGKYQVADWTTASLFKTGMTFETFAESIKESPVPSEFNEDEKQTYLQTLDEQIASLKQRALEVYKANVTKAEKNNIQNQWIDKSKDRMDQLTIELGLGGASRTQNQQNMTKPEIVPTSQIKGN